MNANEIFESLKNNMPAEYEKETAGFLTYDLLKTVSVEDEKIYKAVEAVAYKLNPANLKGDELTRECLYRRGIARKAATFSEVTLLITGAGTIKEGDLFSTANNVKFASTENKTIYSMSTIKAKAVIAGTTGNVGAGSITQIPVTIAGITAVNNPEASYGGYDEETDESLLERYLDDVQKPATSNNIYQFEKWAKEVAGVGKAKVFPTWNGNNTVKVAITNYSMITADSSLVSQVQEYIDPIDPTKWGKGYGTAGIGSYCTVVSATGKTVNIAVDVNISSNYNLTYVTYSIIEAVGKYFQEIAFHETINFVSYAKISALIINIEGVMDILSLTLNGTTGNITLGAEEIPILGTVTAT